MPSTAAFLHADIHADIHALQAIALAHGGMLAARRAMLRQRDAERSNLRTQRASSTAEVEHLKLLIAKLRRMQFGRCFYCREGIELDRATLARCKPLPMPAFRSPSLRTSLFLGPRIFSPARRERPTNHV